MTEKKTSGGLFGKGNGPFRPEDAPRHLQTTPNLDKQLNGPLFRGGRTEGPVQSLREPRALEDRSESVVAAQKTLAQIGTPLASELSAKLTELVAQEQKYHQAAIELFPQLQGKEKSPGLGQQYREINTQLTLTTSELDTLIERIESAAEDDFDLLLTISAPDDIEDEETFTHYLEELMAILVKDPSSDQLSYARSLLSEINTEFYDEEGEEKIPPSVSVRLKWPSEQASRQMLNGLPQQVVTSLQSLIVEKMKADQQHHAQQPDAPENSSNNWKKFFGWVKSKK